jgi:beta-lactamase superfamily II metal-dependent hydrolase
MVFSLEALAALHGDSLLLHFGTTDDPRTVLIDGGPGAAYGSTVKPRLQELRQQLQQAGVLTEGDPLPLALLMVSHIDDDHVGGLVQLADDNDNNAPPWLAPKALWLNTFDDVAGGQGGVATFTPTEQADSKAAAVIASVAQGQKLRSRAQKLGWPINTGFNGLVEAPDTGGRAAALSADTKLLVVSPRTADIERFRKEWDKQIKRMKAGEAKPAEVAAVVDKSPYNLSSIVCLVRQGKHSILLTGDANGDHVRADLKDAGVTNPDGTIHVDILKLPHHGSDRNVDQAFFATITADHYVISASGRYGNPESKTLENIAAARKDDNFTIHLTYAAKEGDLGTRLQAFEQAQRAAGRKFGLETRPDKDLSLRIDLGDPPFTH